MSTTRKNTVIPLYINSKDRVSTSDRTTDFTIALRKDLRNIGNISVSNVGIPRTYTNVNNNNNALQMVFTTEGQETIEFPITIRLTNKEYTGSTLATELQSAFDSNQASIAVGLVWTVAFNTDLDFFTISVVYDIGSSITWSINFTYTPLVDVLGIGSGGTTDDSYAYDAVNTDTLTIPINRRAMLFNNLQLNITSTALTNNINTSYVTSLAKAFSVDADNGIIAFDVAMGLTKKSFQLDLGSDSIGDIFFGRSCAISGDGSVVVVGAYADDGYTGAVYTFTTRPNTIDYFQKPSGMKTQTTLVTANGQEGTSVAISKDGRTMITGVPFDDWELLTGRNMGAAIIYIWTGSQWSQSLKITPGSETPLDQQLGTHVTISGDGLTVAASGLVETIIYTKSGNTWTVGQTFPDTTHPQLNEVGDIMTLYDASLGDIQIWTLTGATWGLSQSISSTTPIVDISDDGLTIVSNGNSVDVYVSTGTYALDTGAPLTQTPIEFGTSVSISGDGNTIAVGDPTDGTIWIYTKTTTWALHSSITVNFVGYSVQLSTDGEKLITGNPSFNNNIGAAWSLYLDTDTDTWKEVPKRIVPSGYSADTDQGYSCALSQSATRFVTGGPIDRNERGAAWVYTRSEISWTQVGTKLLPSDISDTSARFGHAVDISSDASVIVVGAPQDYGGGTSDSDDTGAVWVFRDTSAGDGSEWTQDGLKLYGTPFASNDQQGRSVSISGDGLIIAVGAPASTTTNGGDGRVFIFVYDTGLETWSQQTVLSYTGISATASQGWAVALDQTGITLCVGCPGDEAVAIFTRSDVTWTESALLSGSGVGFGSAIALSADGLTLAIGSPGSVAGDQGYVSVWTKGVNWVLQTTISKTPFGSSVDLSVDGNVLCVGALDGSSQSDITSRTYAYTRSGTTWTQFDDPIVGARRTSTEDYQGFSSAVEYLDDTKTNFALIIGGIGFGAFQGGNWSYFSGGSFNTVETYTVPPRSYSVYEVISMLNSTTSVSGSNVTFQFVFDASTEIVTLTIATTDGISATFKLNDTTTFDIVDFSKATTYNSSFESADMDFSINNNVIKTVNVSRVLDNVIYDNTVDDTFRKYESGFTLSADDYIDIQLRDDRDRIVDLYGVDWVLTVFATIHN